MMTEEERAAEDYKATLSELESISKVEINALTMLAEDNKEYAVQIAGCIEHRLKSAPSGRKLPVLYLIDSICKNNPQSIYVELFTQNIVSNFCNVFEVSDERVRKSLHKLRMTWDKTKTFPQKKLNAIDERVHEMDPNWPILHKLSSVYSQQSRTQQQPQRQQQPNQQQKKQQTQQQQHQQQQQLQQPQQSKQKSHNNATSLDSAVTTKRGNNQSGSRRKRAKTNQNRNNQPSEPIMVAPAPQPFITPQVHPTTFLDPRITMATNEPVPVPVPVSVTVPVQVPVPVPVPTPNTFNQPVQTGPFMQPMICTPFISAPSQPPSQEPQPIYQPVLQSLYGGKQCSNCSLRFDDNNRYSNHLDWHFRQNLKSDNMFARRKWYYPLNLWVQFREINDDDLQENNNPDSNANELLIPINDHEVPTAPASKDDEKNICSVCHETFEKFWAEEEEEWRLKNAKQYDDSRVYHPLCLIDMLQANVVQVNTC